MAENQTMSTVSYPDHYNVLTKRLWRWFASKHNVDLFLHTEAGAVGVHRIVLELLVPSLADFLVPTPSDTLEAAGVQLDLGPDVNCTGDDLELLFELVYLGTADVSEQQLAILRKMAGRLGLQLRVGACKTVGVGAIGQVGNSGRLASTSSGPPESDGVLRVPQGCRPVLRAGTTRRKRNPLKVEGARRLVESSSSERRKEISSKVKDVTPDAPVLRSRPAKSSSSAAGVDTFQLLTNDESVKTRKTLGEESSNPKGADLGSMTGSQLHRCPSCPFTSRSEQRFASHLSVKHDPGRILFKCEKCDRFFVKVETLKQHLLSHEDDLQLYDCRHCKYSTTRKANFGRHMAYKHHRTEDDEPMPANFRCEDCDFACAYQSTMTSHRVREHSVRAPFACPHCSYASISAFNLEKHVNVVHLGLRLNMCETCGRRFSQPAALRDHLRIHTDERPFACPSCHMKFRDKNAVTRHMKTHVSEKPFLCHLCSYSCKRRYNLRAHLTQVHKVTLPSDWRAKYAERTSS